MIKLLKTIFILIALVLLIAVGITTYLIFGTDPNTYKPELEKLASENAVSLKINGDLSWALFPTLAIEVGSTELSSVKHNIPQTSFQQANLTLDWKALLNRKVSFNAIEIKQADIQIRSVKQAQNVAALPAASTVNSQNNETPDTTAPFQLAIDRFTLVDSRVVLVDENNTQRVFESIQFSSEGLNFEQQPFPIELSFSTLLLGDKPSTATLKTELKLNLKKQQFELKGDLAINQPEISARFNAAYDANIGTLKITQLEGDAQSAKFLANAEVTDVTGSPSASGNLKVDNLRIKEWLTEPPKGISNLAFNTDFSASAEKVVLKQYQVTVDQFSAAGAFTLNLKSPRQLEMTLKGNNFDLAGSSSDEQQQESAALLTPILAPLALLNGGKGHIEISLDSIKQPDLNIQKLHINLFANGNVIHVADLSGGIFGGQFQLDTKVNLSNKTPTLTYKALVKDIIISQALPDQKDLKGTLSLNFNGVTAGDNSDSLIANIKGTGKFSVVEPVINNINIERSYCDLAALVEGENTGPQEWNNYTTLGNLSGNIAVKDQIVTLPGFTTSMGNLDIKGNGKVGLDTQTYNMLVTTNLQGDRTSETGCIVKSKRIRNRDIPMRCKGSFGDNTKNSCLPDEGFINQILQDKLVEKLSDKLFKPKEKSSPDATDPEQQNENDLKQQAIDSLLRGIFKK